MPLYLGHGRHHEFVHESQGLHACSEGPLGNGFRVPVEHCVVHWFQINHGGVSERVTGHSLEILPTWRLRFRRGYLTACDEKGRGSRRRSEEHTSELQS